MISATTCLKTIAFPVSRKPEPSEPGVRGGAERQSEFSHALCSMRTHVSASLLVVAAIAGTDFGTLQAAIYYVNNDHYNMDDNWLNAQNLVDSPWETIQRAADVAVAGDFVYVKATDTPYDPFEAKKSGQMQSTMKIYFIGYDQSHSPSDLEDGSGMPWEYDDIDALNDGELEATHAEDSSIIKAMPVIDGEDRTLAGNVFGISVHNQTNIVLRNFHVMNCQRGVDFLNADDSIVKNVYVRNCGEPKVHLSDGRGILLYSSDRCGIRRFVGYNTGHITLTLRKSDDNNVLFCDTYADDNEGNNDEERTNTNTHYHYKIDDSSNNVFFSCTANRLPDPRLGNAFLAHPGHGFCVQAKLFDVCNANTFIDCDAFNMDDPFACRGRAVTNTMFDTCAGIIEDSSDHARGAIAMLHGPKNNTFSSVRIENAKIGMFFSGVNTGPGQYFTTQDVSGNQFLNCIIEARDLAIDLDDWMDEDKSTENLSDGSSLDVVGNAFENCTFVGGSSWVHFFRLARDASGNEFTNCIIWGFSGWDVGPGVGVNSNYQHTPLGFDFNYCCFDLISGFPSSVTDGNVLEDPEFIDMVDYDISSTSPCRDAGTENVVLYWDYDGDFRTSSYDIGAQEYLP